MTWGILFVVALVVYAADGGASAPSLMFVAAVGVAAVAAVRRAAR